MAHQCRPPKAASRPLKSEWRCLYCQAVLIVKEFCGVKTWGRK